MPTNNNTPKLRELLNYLSEEQCAWAIGVLRQRLQQIKQAERALSTDAYIETLGLSVRACNALHSNKLYTVQDVLDYGLDRLHLLRYTGAKTADEIRTAPIATDHPAFVAAETAVRERISRLLGVGGRHSVDHFHKELGKIMWNKCGMSRNQQGLEEAISESVAHFLGR